MTVLSDGVETMRPKNCLTSLRTPKKEAPGGCECQEWTGQECQLGEMVGSRTPEATKE